MRSRKAVLALLAAVLYPAGPQQGGAKEGSETVYALGPGIAPLRLVHRVEPVRTKNSKSIRVNGTVVIGLMVTWKGLPRDVHIVQSLDVHRRATALPARRP